MKRRKTYQVEELGHLWVDDISRLGVCYEGLRVKAMSVSALVDFIRAMGFKPPQYVSPETALPDSPLIRRRIKLLIRLKLDLAMPQSGDNIALIPGLVMRRVGDGYIILRKSEDLF